MLQVPHQPLAIGVVTEQAAIVQALYGVDCAGPFGRRRVAIDQCPGLLLEGHGHIDTQTLDEKTAQGAGEVVQWRQQRFVGQRLASLLGKHAMDLRRLAVADRVADYRVAVRQWPPPNQSRATRNSSVRRASGVPASGCQL